MQIYDTGLPNAHYCAYRGVGPNAVVNGSTCRRADGVEEVPLDALASYAPQSVYILLGTNVLTQDRDYSSFLNYYGLMLEPHPGAFARRRHLRPVHHRRCGPKCRPTPATAGCTPSGSSG